MQHKKKKTQLDHLDWPLQLRDSYSNFSWVTKNLLWGHTPKKVGNLRCCIVKWFWLKEKMPRKSTRLLLITQIKKLKKNPEVKYWNWIQKVWQDNPKTLQSMQYLNKKIAEKIGKNDQRQLVEIPKWQTGVKHHESQVFLFSVLVSLIHSYIGLRVIICFTAVRGWRSQSMRSSVKALVSGTTSPGSNGCSLLRQWVENLLLSV